MITLSNPIQDSMMTVNFSGAFLTVENHGCVYTVCTEGQLFFAPIYEDGSVNLEEFDYVEFDLDDDEELKSIQNCLCNMMKVEEIYFRQSMTV